MGNKIDLVLGRTEEPTMLVATAGTRNDLSGDRIYGHIHVRRNPE